MAACFLFFRCWPGFTEPFPFERFNGLSETELSPALESFTLEQLQTAEVRERIKHDGKQRRKRFTVALKRQSSKRTGGAARVTPDLSPNKSFSQKRWEWIRRASRKDLLICRLGAYLGWWHSEILGLSGPVVPRIWFCEARSGEFAEQLVAELMNAQSRLIKLTTLSKRDFDTHELEYHANPRYGFISAAGLSGGARASIRRCIQAIQEGREPAVDYGSLVLPIGQRALAVALDLEKAWPAEKDEELPAALPAAPAIVTVEQSEGNGEADDYTDWITVGQAHIISGVNKGVISRATTTNEIKNNGKRGRSRLLDPGSFAQWRLQHSPPVESTPDPEEVIERAKAERRRRGVIDDD